jgi:poly(3-hydroxybutyrate) depolymerase
MSLLLGESKMKRQFEYLIALFVLVAVVSVILRLAGSDVFAQEQGVEKEIKSGKMAGTKYRIYVPASVNKDKPTPVVFAFPGNKMKPSRMEVLSGFDIPAEREGFIVVYMYDYTAEATFAVLDEVDRDYEIDRSRVYSVGFSKGAVFTYYLASEYSDKIAAIGIVAGRGVAEPTRPVSAVIIHGTEDEFSQGPSMAEKWAEAIGAGNPNTVMLPDKEDDGRRVSKTTYSNGKDGAEVVLYTVKPGIHDWPLGTRLRSTKKNSCRDIESCELMWEVFARHCILETKKDSSVREAPERTILYIIDGLAEGAPEKMPLANIEELKKRGCYYKAVHLPLPDHPPQSDDYPYTCSIPNLVMMSGTVFLRPNLEMLQDCFAGQKTAFVVDAPAYVSISSGYSIYEAMETKPPFDDEAVVKRAMEIIEKENPRFLRIHLQGSGVAGYESGREENKDKPWYHDIWQPESPYIEACKKSDGLLGELVKYLEDSGRMERSVIIVMGDHGQARGGGHPPYAEGSSITPMLIFGQGIKKGRVFDYAEMTDVAPTIAYLHNIAAPKESIGRVLLESIEGQGKDTIPTERYMERLNKALIAQHKLASDKGEILNPIREIPQWYKQFGAMKSLVEYQEAQAHKTY